LGDSPGCLNFMCQRFGTPCPIFIGLANMNNNWHVPVILPAYTIYENGTYRAFRNVGTKYSDPGESPKRNNATFRQRRKFEIKYKILLFVRYLKYYEIVYCTGPCGSAVWVQVTHHLNSNDLFNNPTWNTYKINTLFTSCCSCLNTYVLCTLHVLQLRTCTVPESLWYDCVCKTLTFSTIY